MNKKIQDGYLEVVFANRNKAYGAYDLRTSYNKRMLYSGLIASSLAMFLFGWMKLSESNNLDYAISDNFEKVRSIEISTVVIPEVEKPIEVPKITKAEVGRTAKTQQYTAFNVVKDSKKINNKAKVVVDDALVGPVDNAGLEGGNAIALDKSVNDGPANMENVLSKKGNDIIGESTPVATSNKPFIKVEQMPVFPGGDAALMEYLQSNIVYPRRAIENEVQGKVFVSFVIDKNGDITNVEVTRSLGSGCTEEAVRVIKAMPKWKPGKQNGYPVKVKKVIPVEFKLRG